MATHKFSPTFLVNDRTAASPGLSERYFAFVDEQEPNAMAWWLGSLMVHGCILVPLSFLLVYSLDGPTAPFLGISMTCFFINIIANMGGAAFRFIFNSFAFSILVHIVIVAATLFLAA